MHQWLKEHDGTDGPKTAVVSTLQASLNTTSDPRLAALVHCMDLYTILRDQMAVESFLTVMETKVYHEGEHLNSMESNPEHCFLIVKGRVVVSVDDTTFRGSNSAGLDPHEVGTGMFIADINNLQASVCHVAATCHVMTLFREQPAAQRGQLRHCHHGMPRH